MRGFGVYGALAYDWLHDAPGVDAGLLALARDRFQAWTTWYPENGYLPDNVGANYHAGYMFGDTLIAIAQGGEAGANGTSLWQHVLDEIWNDEMTAGVQPGGVLDGGDWHEGWQYGPLSVAEYALGVRAMRENGVDLTPLFDDWTSSMAVREHYAGRRRRADLHQRRLRLPRLRRPRHRLPIPNQ
jgi:hypothetical protein